MARLGGAHMILYAMVAAALWGNAAANCASGQYIDPNNASACLACSTCPSGQFVGRGCTATNDTSCALCAVCLTSQYQVAPCAAAVNTQCADISRIAFGSTSFDGGVASAVYIRAPGDFRAAAVTALGAGLGLPSGQIDRLVNLSLVPSGTAVLASFSVLPDRSFWGNQCVVDASIILTGVTRSSWTLRGEPVSELSAAISTALGAAVAAQRDSTNITVAVSPIPTFTTTTAAVVGGFAAAFGTFDYTATVAGASCAVVTAAATALANADFLRTLRRTPVALATATAVNVGNVTIKVTPPSAGAAFASLQAAIAAGNVSVVVTEGSVTSTIPATSSALLREDTTALSSDSPGNASTSSKTTIEWWHILVIVGMALVLVLLVAVSIHYCRVKQDHAQTVKDKIVSRDGFMVDPPMLYEPNPAFAQTSRGPDPRMYGRGTFGGIQPASYASHYAPAASYVAAPPPPQPASYLGRQQPNDSVPNWPPTVTTAFGAPQPRPMSPASQADSAAAAFAMTQRGFGQSMHETPYGHPRAHTLHPPRAFRQPVAPAVYGYAQSDGGFARSNADPEDWHTASEPGWGQYRNAEPFPPPSAAGDDAASRVDFFDPEHRDVPQGLDEDVRDPIIKARQRSMEWALRGRYDRLRETANNTALLMLARQKRLIA
eukprot:CAMPEP_0206300172 /NCGR_PEP_ID=MMETSP0106_2-20121207/7565_1 /ASSEMBLY_ACC=CAM_ASM_000206 /TAXON_ID=81532 /ORGANISM="Acanthoeca-like sp., Strain 10tr" /LENGTH=660 /DNA_ID=CAMNT_0053730889 /DNA_START=157 /DNA_END=2140 /DNA_ORIENTATION=+